MTTSPRRIVFLASLLLTVLFLCVPVVAQAEELRSDSFVIQFGNFNVTSGEKDSASFSLTDTVGQTADGPFGQYGSSSYFVGSGFQYIYQIDEFSFTISTAAIDLGILTPGIHNTASHTLTVSTRGAGGYTVYAYELHPLRHSNGTDEIPDTTCDNGSCTETTASVWTDQYIPGFGYNMSGDDIPAAFVNTTYFKQFADNETAEAMQVVMSSANIAADRTATVLYKAGAGGTQAAGAYQTAISYIAVPGY